MVDVSTSVIARRVASPCACSEHLVAVKTSQVFKDLRKLTKRSTAKSMANVSPVRVRSTPTVCLNHLRHRRSLALCRFSSRSLMTETTLIGCSS